MIRELKEIVEDMLSEDYKVRFYAEVEQLAIRIVKLSQLIEKQLTGTLEFEPTCNVGVLIAQRDIMSAYLDILVLRAMQEDVDTSPIFEEAE